MLFFAQLHRHQKKTKRNKQEWNFVVSGCACIHNQLQEEIMKSSRKKMLEKIHVYYRSCGTLHMGNKNNIIAKARLS